LAVFVEIALFIANAPDGSHLLITGGGGLPLSRRRLLPNFVMTVLRGTAMSKETTCECAPEVAAGPSTESKFHIPRNCTNRQMWLDTFFVV